MEGKWCLRPADMGGAAIDADDELCETVDG